MEENKNTTTTTASGGKNMMPIIIGVVVLLLIGGVAYMASQNKSVAPQTTMEENSDKKIAPSHTNDNSPTGSMSEEKNDSPAVKEFTIEGSNFKFNPAEIRVKKGDTVKITFKNTGGLHDWVVDEFNARTQRIQADESETIRFVADKAGTFEYYCSVGDHRQMGMKGNLIVE
jgi:plastocyanin